MARRKSASPSFWKIFFAVLGVLVAIAALFCVAVLINCAVEGLTFGEVLTKWFTKAAETLPEAAEEASELTV